MGDGNFVMHTPTNKPYSFRADLLAFLAVAGLVFCVWLVGSDGNLPERAVNAIMFVAGVLASAVRDVYGFEFGSSRGSREKDATIASQQRKLDDPL